VFSEKIGSINSYIERGKLNVVVDGLFCNQSLMKSALNADCSFTPLCFVGIALLSGTFHLVPLSLKSVWSNHGAVDIIFKAREVSQYYLLSVLYVAISKIVQVCDTLKMFNINGVRLDCGEILEISKDRLPS